MHTSFLLLIYVSFWLKRVFIVKFISSHVFLLSALISYLKLL